MISICKWMAWLWLLIGMATTQAAPPLSAITDELRQRLDVGDERQSLRAEGMELRQPVVLRRFYAQREYRPTWLDTRGVLPVADTLLQAVALANREGLRPADYHLSALKERLAASHVDSGLSAAKWAAIDLLLSDSWLTYASHLLSGRTSPAWAVKLRSRDLVPLLEEALKRGDVKGALDALVPRHPGYSRLRSILADYREMAKKGGWPGVSLGPRLVKGNRDLRVKELRARLQFTGDLPQQVQVTALGAIELFDENLRQAVRHFQRRHGIRDDGIVGSDTLAELNVPITERIHQIEANMERWRWLPDDLGQRYILVNVPDFSMAVSENGRRIMDAKVIVGQSVRQTPVFSANMSYLVLNPRWYVPQSIAVKDKLPQLRKNAYALSKQNIRVFDASGQEIDPGGVDWHSVSINNFPYRLRQDPGSHNALGRVKFMFPNPFNVYLHDTPSQELFNRSRRTFSSGCIRVSKPMELAEYLLRGDPRWNREAILAALSTARQRVVKLPEEIPVYILYWTAWVDEDGVVNFRNDIYKRDEPSLRTEYSL